MAKVFVQVVFRQGLIRNILADGETTVADFMEKVRQFGRIRLIREIRDVKPGDDGLDLDNLPARRTE